MSNISIVSNFPGMVLRALFNICKWFGDEFARAKSNFYDLTFHLIYMFYGLNYIVFLQTGQYLLGPSTMSSEIYLSGFSGLLFLAGAACFSAKILFHGYTLRLGIEFVVLTLAVLSAPNITPIVVEIGDMQCGAIALYSLVRIIQMAGTDKIRG